MRLAARVDRFVCNFTDRREAIGRLSSGPYVEEFKKILYVSILDSVAGVVHPRQSNRNRFTAFVSTFCAWSESQRVSLPHLDRVLALSPDPGFDALRAFAREQLAGWIPGEAVLLDSDPTLVEVLALWPTGKELGQPFGRLRAESLQHVNLLYQCRNCLVHEFREPAAKFSLSSIAAPHYIAFLNRDSGEDTWLLDYPVEFFASLVDSSLTAVGPYLVSQGIDPDETYYFGEYWLKELNR